ncbi:hypothetical protein ACQP2U_24135 [Nocardia sp. CA-084685]|uniref:hypothetical protein n=1 Tax=Nocardia sp. CA-084685 TaxID=3239970 RepID=UPI003D960657
MSAATEVSALQQIRDQLDQISGTYCTPAFLRGLINAALKVPAPAGDVGIAGARVETYKAAVSTTDLALTDMGHVVENALPTAWRGAGAESAAQALRAVGMQSMNISNGFDDGHTALSTWVGHLSDAQKRDGQGRKQLNDALARLSFPQPAYMARFGDFANSELPGALHAAKSGCQDMIGAAQLAAGAAHDAIAALNKSAANARINQLTTHNVDPLTAVTLTYANPGVLDPTALTQGSLRLDSMSAADRAAFEKLLAGAQSLAEAGYLWKALSAGYSAGDIAAFDQVIHPHGNDPAWLNKHLDPMVRDLNTTPGANNAQILSYGGVNWYPVGPGAHGGYAYYSQGGYDDCVAASTTVASLSRDPVRMLGVTTGQGPVAVDGSKVGDDGTDAVHARLQKLYLQNYYDGQTADGVAKPNNTNGIGTQGQTMLDARLLAPSTGGDYQIKSLDSQADREAALPGVQAAAAAGKPVPVDVVGTHTEVVGTHTEYDHSIPHHRPEPYDVTSAHQLVIVGAQGDELEVYNPWGRTQWVTTQQFVDGEMGEVTSDSPDGGMPRPYEVQVPQ